MTRKILILLITCSALSACDILNMLKPPTAAPPTGDACTTRIGKMPKWFILNPPAFEHPLPTDTIEIKKCNNCEEIYYKGAYYQSCDGL